MEEIVELLRRKIMIESSPNMTTEQENYVVGLSDALEIVENYMSEKVTVGKKYYVLMHNDNQAQIEQMQLYRINSKKKSAYCFTRNFQNPSPDLVLYSKGGLKLRVFNDYESAENGIPLFLLSLNERGKKQ